MSLGELSGIFVSSSARSGSALTRRDALRQGALFTAAAVTAAPSFVAEAVAADDGSTDIVFRNGSVYTVNSKQPWARAVAVKGKRIAFVGDEASVQSFVGPQTRVVDLAGKMLLPGFVEGHTHPLVGSVLTRGADLQFDTKEDILAALRTYRDKMGPMDVVRGFGWRYNAFPTTGPRKEDLDAIWPITPVILIGIDGHGAGSIRRRWRSPGSPGTRKIRYPASASSSATRRPASRPAFSPSLRSCCR